MPNHTPPGWPLDDPSAALHTFLTTLPGPPRLLGLGEPSHAIDAVPAWALRLLRPLVEEHGFRSVAVESDAVAGLRVNAHVTAGEGGVNDVLLTGFSHGFGARPAYRDLVTWLRNFNAPRQAADHVRFYGVDASTETMWASSPRTSLLALHAFLGAHLSELPADAATIEELCGEDTRWTNRAAAMDAAQSVGADDRARTLRWLADELLTLLEAERARLSAHPDALWHAHLHARTAQGLLRYHAVMADPTPRRVARMLTLRDAVMADHLVAVAERERPRGPTLILAHNQHLHRHLNHWRFGPEVLEWSPAGLRLTERLGDQYAVIATAVGEGEGLPPPLPGTVEGWLAAQSGAPRLYATRDLLRTMPDGLTRRADTAGNHAYSPLRPEHLGATDGLLVLPRAGFSP
ncbi:erythromycin esterase-like protein [Deinococcus metalli]|uniref:Erythromycin esterase n=1 Tax=Deinococcus metalli TaxID=1141878 RepID=A0A7W8KAR0_9DEIO|nr:erythromycin esterase family protein [Deinococcus metalli]MBB5374636.1 erythromycin esterase-like protein [Deinococcus metalli]GHF34840.1 erythromycin esterase [Deinococcus metalli]